MFCYSAYDLRIGSDIPLPELLPGAAGSDVAVRLEPPGSLVAVKSIVWTDHPAGDASFSFPRAGQFLIQKRYGAGQQVLIRPDPRADHDYLRMYVQGMVLAAVLYQRGFFVLHSSVVNLEGRAIAFIGPVGAGKSSLASAFYARGHGVIADDNAALDLAAGEVEVMSAFPVLKVYPDIAASLGHDRLSLKLIHASQQKRAQSVEQRFPSAPGNLHAIYVLDREIPPFQVARLTLVESVTELIRHSVPTRWGIAGNARHLQMCGQVARRTPMFRIRTFTTLDEISSIVRLIECQSASSG